MTATRPTIKDYSPFHPPGWELMYPYTSDLLCLDACRPPASSLPPALAAVSTPLVIPAWELALQAHPDRAFAQYIIDGLRHGFRIGFNRGGGNLRSAPANMRSAQLHPGVISEYLSKELARGRMLGPFSPSFSTPELQINRFGVIPKGQTGKWRLITDLSFPPDQSVNDGICRDLCSLSYTTVDHVAEVAVDLGPGALMAKVDIESAYRLIPVHPQDRPLQAVQWRDQIFVDPMLPFGLHSAPKIFNAVADGLHWHLQRSGIQRLYHYLDDFIMLGPPHSPQCQGYLDTLLYQCNRLGVPIAAHKTKGPSSCLVFLGIEIDTVAGELRLPADKLQRLQTLLQQWGDKKVCTRKELESLVGSLNHACKGVRAGRSFLRRMIDLLHSRRHNSAGIGPPIRRNFERTWHGGGHSHPLGTAYRSYQSLTSSRCTRSPRTPQASGAVGHGLERDGSKSSGIPPLLHSPSLSRSCYPSCWLEFSGVGHGETTRWCATAITRPVCTPALASTRDSCTCCEI